MNRLLRNFIIGLVGLLGIGSLTSVVSGMLSVASGSPIKSVVKEVVSDSAKENALNTLWGRDGNDNGFSLPSLFSKTKFKEVSDKKSGPWGYIAPKWYAEVYRIDTSVYIGNRRFNKPNGVNMKWSTTDSSSFEIGDFKKGVTHSDSYIAYDANSCEFVIGNLKKYKLNGYCLVYDEYYKRFEFKEYKKGKPTGYSFKVSKGDLKYYKDKKVVGTYNSKSGNFDVKKNSIFNFFNRIKNPNDLVKVKVIDNGYKFIVDNSTYTISTDDDNITYKSDNCKFKGNAYKFNCTYKYNKKHSITYDFTTLTHLGISCTDGTRGEVKIVDDSDSSESALTLKAISEAVAKVGMKAVVDTVIETASEGVPQIKALDMLLKVTTGQGLSDSIMSKIEDSGSNDGSNSSITDKIRDTYNNITNQDDYHSLGDKIKDGLGIETYEEKEEKRREEAEKRGLSIIE